MDLTLTLPSSINHETHRVQISSSPSGWTNNDVGLAWLNRSLIAVQRQRLNLPIDCLSLMAMDLTSQWILSSTAIRTRYSFLYILLTQPKCYNRLMLLCLNLLLQGTQMRSQALWRGKRDKETTILKVFEATGLSPFDPEVVLRRFNTSSSFSSNSESPTLSASNWRKTESLLCQVVKD
jgi:hypothetical protein